MGTGDDRTPTFFAEQLNGRPDYFQVMAAAKGDELLAAAGEKQAAAGKDLADVTSRLVHQTKGLKLATWALVALAFANLIWLLLRALVIAQP